VLVELEWVFDERGGFARTFDVGEWEARNMLSSVMQCSLSRNDSRGTLRGMHYQVSPYEETKLVRCSAGAIYDVAVDLRPDSQTFCEWFGTELSADNGRMLFVPEGFAHGFVTLTDSTDVVYQMSRAYEASAARGVRWDDPAFAIEWPLRPMVMSERDRSFPGFRK
jgi:dTDP-4-dehydrorhamnose 3,5-epimerase